MFELLVPPELMQLDQVEGDKHAYDLQLRPCLMLQAIQVLQAAGVEPDVWKVEGLDRREDAVKLVEVARRGGRNSVGLIVLVRGAERDRVEQWLKTAASVADFIGFAVGRTSFWQSLVDVEAKHISQEEAATRIAHNFETWIRLFEEARSDSRRVLIPSQRAVRLQAPPSRGQLASRRLGKAERAQERPSPQQPHRLIRPRPVGQAVGSARPRARPHRGASVDGPFSTGPDLLFLPPRCEDVLLHTQLNHVLQVLLLRPPSHSPMARRETPADQPGRLASGEGACAGSASPAQR